MLGINGVWCRLAVDGEGEQPDFEQVHAECDDGVEDMHEDHAGFAEEHEHG